MTAADNININHRQFARVSGTNAQSEIQTNKALRFAQAGLDHFSPIRSYSLPARWSQNFMRSLKSSLKGTR